MNIEHLKLPVNSTNFPNLSSLKKAARLQPGDEVRVLSLSAGLPAIFPERYQAGVRQFEKVFGVKITSGKYALRPADWIYNNPAARAEDLMAAFADSNVKAIVSSIGGDESIRLIPYVDLKVIAENPKIFMGFSDTTVTHFMCLKAGLSSIYGPSIMTSFAENTGMHPYTVSALQQVLFANQAIGKVQPNTMGWTVEHLDWSNPKNQEVKRKLLGCTGPRFISGQQSTEGRAIGGCLEVLQFLQGTALWPELEIWKKAILFVETSEEGMPANRVACFFRNLAAQGILQEVSGIMFSKPGGHLLNPETFIDYDAAILSVLKEYGLENKPVVSNLDFGHTEPFFPIAYGSLIKIDPLQKSLEVLEPSVI